jgi:hypothetical protein
MSVMLPRRGRLEPVENFIVLDRAVFDPGRVELPSSDLTTGRLGCGSNEAED